MKRNLTSYIVFFVSLIFLLEYNTIIRSENIILTKNNEFNSVNLVIQDINIETPRSTPVRVDVVNNIINNCSSYSISITSYPNPQTQGTAVIDGEFIVFTPVSDYVGNVSIPFSINCDSENSSAVLNVNVTRYSVPLNMVPADVLCVEEMPQNVTFSPVQRGGVSTYKLDGVTMALVGDLNGDKKPEIIGLGLLDGYGGGQEAIARYIVIYNSDGTISYRFDLRSLNESPNAANGYGGTSQFRLRAEPRHNAPGHLAIADLDRDGLGEIVVCETGSLGRVYALKPTLDPATGDIIGFTKMWDGTRNGVQYSSKAPYTSDVTVFGSAMPYISDLNGDGIPEVIVYNKIFNGVTGELIIETETLGGYRNDPIGTILTESYFNELKAYSYVGRRVGRVEMDNCVNIISIIDIDNDGIMEIVAGNKIYYFDISETDRSIIGIRQIVHGPESANVSTRQGQKTYYFGDGWTTVADIDGDGFLDIIIHSQITTNWDDDYRGILMIYDPRFPTVVKAVTCFRGNSQSGTASIQFVGDINGKPDGPGNSKLPEICLSTGVLYRDINGSHGDNYITGIPFHPLADDALRNGTFDTGRSGNRKGTVFALTYDETETDIQNRLKLSWAMEHNDRSAVTGITMFDFDNDGNMDLCYRDETTLRVISPSKGTSYIRVDETTHPAVLFRSTGVKSFTGYEAPIIADVNLDGSADIVSFCFTESGTDRSWGYPFIFEYEGGTDKWAPAPPVWNQTIYFPLQINEDLTVPTSPISTLTSFVDRNGETIYPYNGCWVQQPIVKEGQPYVPVVRQPDAALVEIDVITNGTENAAIEITIANNGTASINAQDPISFYANTTDEGIENSDFITSVPIGRDIFPNETVVMTYILTGDYRNHLIWARIMDEGNNTPYPSPAYIDCDTSNNTISGFDCPSMTVNIIARPDTVLCGTNGIIELVATAIFRYGQNATYQWYRNGEIIPGETSNLYLAEEPGAYRVYVTDIVCKEFSNSIELTEDTTIGLADPVIVNLFGNSEVCGPNGAVILKLVNSNDYPNTAQFQWYNGADPILGAVEDSLIFVREAGSYRIRITDGTCMIYSQPIDITFNNTITTNAPLLEAVPEDAKIYDGSPVTILLQNVSDFPNNPLYHWFLYENITLDETSIVYSASEVGRYRLVVEEGDCLYISNNIDVSIGNCVYPTFDVSDFSVCQGQVVRLDSTVTNVSTNSTVRFYYDYAGTLPIADLTIEEGLGETTKYYLAAVDNTTNCESDIDSLIITVYNNPTLIASVDFTTICRNDNALLNLAFTGIPDWSFTYEYNGNQVTVDNISTNTYEYSISPDTTTTYTIVEISDANCRTTSSYRTTVTVKDLPATDGLQTGDYVWIGNKDTDLSTRSNWNDASNWRQFNGTAYTIPSSPPSVTTDVFLKDASSCIYSDEININNDANSHNITIEEGFTFNLGNVNLNITGNFENYGIMNAGTSNIIISGTELQNIKTNYYAFYNVEINKPQSSTNTYIDLVDDFGINNSATFTNGIINTGANRVIFFSGATSGEGNENSFIDGFVEKNGNTEFTFPVGNITTRNIDGTSREYRIWAPFGLIPADDGAVNVRYVYGNQNMPPWWYHDDTHDFRLTHTSDREYWYLVSDVNINNFTLYWKNNNPCIIHDFCDSLGDFMSQYLTTTYWDGRKWIFGGGTAVNNHIEGSITSDIGITTPEESKATVSTFVTFASTSNEVPLPVELIKFDVFCNENNVNVNWITATEYNSDYFVLERSYDLIQFKEIYRVDAANFSNSIKDYSFTDYNISNNNVYYRLKQVDFDGYTTIYDIKNADCNNLNNDDARITIYPNPTDYEVNIILENFSDNIVVFEIYDELGKSVIIKRVNLSDNNYDIFNINVSNLEPAIYYLKTQSQKLIFNNKIIIQHN